MSRLSRRQFHQSAGVAASAVFGFQFVPSHVWGVNSRPALGAIGTGGKGQADIGGAVGAGFEVAALVDVVDVQKMTEADAAAGRVKSRLGSMEATRSTHPDARFYRDYREMLADMGDKVDAVTVSTPDHHHFHAARAAILAGKHVYCQKPVTHGIWEARELTRLAREKGVQTQMGNQAHANDHLRRVVELVRGGILGKVSEVHAWTNRPIWPQGFATPPDSVGVPPGIDWEQWIGPAPWVDYSPLIAPFAWRGWWDYGTGALGDMACHIMDMPYWALELGAPAAVSAVEEGGSELSPPINSTVTYEFAEKDVRLFWYDGQKGARFDREKWVLEPGEFNRPGNAVLEGMDHKSFGSVVVGERGKLYFDRFKDTWIVRPGSALDGFKEWPEQSIPRARDEDNYKEWRDAIDGKVEHGQSHFGYAGPFTETILLGGIAQRNPGERLEWDAANLEIVGRPELKPLIQRSYRDGWAV